MIARRCWYNKSWWWGGWAFGRILNFFPFQVRLSRYIICYFHRVADDLEDIIHMIHFHPSSRLVEVGAFCCVGYYGEVCPTWLFCAVLRKKQRQSASWWVTRHPRDTSSDNWQLPVPRCPATVILTVNVVHKPAEPKIFERKESSQILSPKCRSSDWRLAKEAPNPHWSQQPMRQTWRSSLLSFRPSHGIARIEAVVKPDRKNISWRFSVEVMQKKSIIHFKFSKWFVQTKSSTTCFWTLVCVFFYHLKFTWFGVWSLDIPKFFHFKGSEKKHQGRVDMNLVDPKARPFWVLCGLWGTLCDCIQV